MEKFFPFYPSLLSCQILEILRQYLLVLQDGQRLKRAAAPLQGLAGATLTACACSTSGTKKSVWIYPRCLQRCCFFTLLAKSRPNTHSRLTSSTWGENILYFSTVNPTPGGEAGMGKLKPKACMNRGGSDCCWSGIASCQLSVYKLPKRRLRRHGMPHSTSMSKNTHWVLLWWQWECTNNVFRPKTSTRNNKRLKKKKSL